MMGRCVTMAVLLSAAPVRGGTPATLDCTGAFARTADEAALVARFGRANVSSGDVAGAEGATERGTVVFAKDPARRIEILWADPKHRRRPVTILIRDRSAWLVRPGGPDGGDLKLGMAIEAVEAANLHPFKLNGFGWDMGGYAAGWLGGRLEPAPGGCSLSVRFDPDPKARSAALDKVSGEKTFTSADPKVRAVHPTVSQISLDWPE